MTVDVDVTFSSDGTLRVRRIRAGGSWLAVEQGRQWADGDGRHVLVMLPDGARELVLRADTFIWELRDLSGGRAIT